MLFRESSLALYRILDFGPILDSLFVSAEPQLCTICRGVLQHCNTHLETLCTQVSTQAFEYTDFKITFSISIIAYLKRLLVIGMAEEELGKAFRYKQTKDRSVVDFKEVYKWIMSPLIAKRLNVPANLDGTFLIHVSFAQREEGGGAFHENTVIQGVQNEMESFSGMLGKGAKWKAKQDWKHKKDNHANQSGAVKGAEQVISSVSKLALPLLKELDVFKSQEIAQIDLNTLMSVDCTMDNILLYGRYVKLSREVSQTPWNLGTKRMHSVQALISDNLLPIFGSKQAFLHAAGREDIDVRMLGRGRPFVMEFVNPKKSLSCQGQIEDKGLRKAINSSLVYCHEFKIVDKEFFDSLKDIEISKAKSYSCMVWVKRRITPQDCNKLSTLVSELHVQQTTPIRVLHRRSLAVREKVIHRLQATYINQHYMHICLLASAGTYIKEFVHGDLGRTTPSVGSLLESEADILQLDVTNVYDSVQSVAELPLSKLFEIEVVSDGEADDGEA
ncbi:hypothetical protein FGO68_gene15427 [Halteria grandinella]|uniref:tRNA pseudouridine(55) synthase n=1 Tax=Halteria grandinella TaxID=5974 RepID=A0A8J8NQI2_HALGN|nr:hypothetical protein FGO68_gene15427 [Halteria grandinella]